MSTHNIQFHHKINKLFFKNNCFFLNYLKNFVETQKRVRISHGKCGIRVRAIEVRLYIILFLMHLSTSMDRNCHSTFLVRITKR